MGVDHGLWLLACLAILGLPKQQSTQDGLGQLGHCCLTCFGTHRVVPGALDGLSVPIAQSDDGRYLQCMAFAKLAIEPTV